VSQNDVEEGIILKRW